MVFIVIFTYFFSNHLFWQQQNDLVLIYISDSVKISQQLSSTNMEKISINTMPDEILAMIFSYIKTFDEKITISRGEFFLSSYYFPRQCLIVIFLIQICQTADGQWLFVIKQNYIIVINNYCNLVTILNENLWNGQLSCWRTSRAVIL